MFYMINNDYITVQIDSLGAEIKSVIRNGTQYMWCGDPAFWAQTSPILFPIVGKLKDGKYRIGKTEYKMQQHGFARSMEFRAIDKTGNSITFELKSDKGTLEKYPYRFVLHITYKLICNILMVEWNVKNTGITDMFFSIGAHPAIVCPLDTGEKEDCLIRFNTDKDIVYYRLQSGLIDKSKPYILPVNGGYANIESGLFDDDALIIEGEQAKEISLCKKDGSAYVTVTTNAPLFGLWSPPKKNAPFICIEPWYGRCDSVDFDGEFSEREYTTTLKPNGVFKSRYTIEFKQILHN